MITFKEIQEAICRLSRMDRAVLRAWLDEDESRKWDRELEADEAAGRLDWLRQEAKDDLRAGRCTNR